MSDIINVIDKEELSLHFGSTRIGVVTALQKELDALINLSIKDEPIAGVSRVYHKLTFDYHGEKFTIIAHTLDEMGTTAMTTTLMEVLTGFPDLEYVALIGIAAGSDSDEQDFGDILIPKTVFNYEAGKYAEKDGNLEFKSDKLSYPIDTDIVQLISAVANDQTILDNIQNEWQIKRSDKLKVHSGNFACGSSVVASKKRVKQIERNIARKYIGIDMETFALVTVSQLKPDSLPKLFIVKSITDFADSEKDDTEHPYATYTAAKFFIEFTSRIIVKRLKSS